MSDDDRRRQTTDGTVGWALDGTAWSAGLGTAWSHAGGLNILHWRKGDKRRGEGWIVGCMLLDAGGVDDFALEEGR